MLRKLILIALIAPVPHLAAAPALASEEGFIERFEGAWTGSGSARRNIDNSPWKLRCNMSGNSGGNRIAINGNCRAAVIVSRSFGADIRYNPSSRRYTGTYTGARVGPAKLSGRRKGDAVVMTITWPKPVNGDTKATLTIRNRGNGQMMITLTDRLKPGGPVEAATDIVLAKN